MEKNDNKWRWLLLLVFIVVPIINFGVFLLPGGQEQFRNTPDTRIDAAAYAFPIVWSVIFFGMIAFSLHLVRNKEPATPFLRQAIIGLIVAGLASIAFVPISLYASFVASWFDILVHLLGLIWANWNLRKHVAVTSEHSNPGRWTFYAPSMYLGWISAAMAISSALALHELNITVDPELGTIVTLMVICCLTVVGALVIARRDTVFGLTLAWAFVAVGVEQSAFPMIRKAAWGGAALLILLAAVTFFCKKHFYAIDQPDTLTDSEEQ